MNSRKIGSRLIGVCASIIILICCLYYVEAHDEKGHAKILEKVLLGRSGSIASLSEEGKDAIQAVEEASAMMIDQFNGSDQQTLISLRKKVKSVPSSISEIDYPANSTSHREYTHRGWDDSFYSNEELKKSNWKTRKSILTNTVKQCWISDKNKCEAFSKIIYYIHILGDYQYDLQQTKLKKMGTYKNSDTSTIEHTDEPKLTEEERNTAETIYTRKELPMNYISKIEAEELNWNLPEGKLVGGDKHGNYEKLLPALKNSNNYFECDLGYEKLNSSKQRGKRRFVYSKGEATVVYFTPDHYKEFYLIYPEIYLKKARMIDLGGRKDKMDIVDELISAIEVLLSDQKSKEHYDLLIEGLTELNKEMSSLQSLGGGINTNGRWLKYYGYADRIIDLLIEHFNGLLSEEDFYKKATDGKKGLFGWAA